MNQDTNRNTNRETKLKMSPRKYRAILMPCMALFLVLAVVVTYVTNYFTPSLDAFLGKGSRTVSTPRGTSGWDRDFYSFNSSSR